jgi:hypothetical protein
MDEITNKPLDNRLIDLAQTAMEKETPAAAPAAAPPPAPKAEAAFPDKIEEKPPDPGLGGLLPPETPLKEGDAGVSAPPPELASKLDTRMAMARLKEDALLQGETASAPVGPPPTGPAAPPAVESAAGTNASTQVARSAEDVLGRMYDQAQSILDSGFSRAEEILQFSESAAAQIEEHGAQDAGNILTAARDQAEQIRQRAYEEYQPPSIGLPGEGEEEPPPSIGLPEGGGETPGGESSDWDDMLRDLFNKAMAEADDVMLRGQSEADDVLAQARALAQQTRDNGRDQSLEVRQAAINSSNLIHEYGRNISTNLRQEGIKRADFSQLREELQRAEIRDADFRNTLQHEIQSMEDLLAGVRRPDRSG